MTYPGSNRTRQRARRQLEAREIRPGTWLVTGGEIGHGVTVGGDLPVYTCDCGKQPYAVNGMCSHCIAVWLEIDGQCSPRWADKRPRGRQGAQ